MWFEKRNIYKWTQQKLDFDLGLLIYYKRTKKGFQKTEKSF